ncbi:hypothetical protein H4R99_003034 [Coemansia sp. RSA 1722]|nr:hypothetical protein IWW45_006201 [Coemansia sp. RSA 485]KAJ2601391.1 hypothetical protein H4R99_003034 [Coemansia sp. RSA 1722]KAJ2603060.1 hypothetical protein GGF39_000379 [Coemansia sp. RSA 1721]KAJ2640406.1 hypothetical protein GGF40_000054 [Coemansia sp. RSA 1286]
MSRGRGWGGGARREMNGLQTELLRDRKLRKLDSGVKGTFPEYEMIPGRPLTSEEKHIANLMDEFRNELKSSVFYLKSPPAPPEVERFSDRYHTKEDSTKSLKELKTDIALFPEELQSVLLKKRTKKAKKADVDGDGVLAALKDVKDEDEDDDDDEKSGKEDDEQDEVLEEEEDEEEGNDYMDSYFDNGEEDDIGDIDDDEGGGDYY